MTPRTAGGKLVTMVYALFGVPLMLMCLSSLGGLLAEAIQCAYCRVCRREARRNGVPLQESSGVQRNKLALTNGDVAKQKGAGRDGKSAAVLSCDEVSSNLINC